MPTLQNKYFTISICLAILIIVFVTFYFFRKSKKISSSETNNKEDKAEVIAYNITLKEISPNKIKGWEISCKIAKFFKDKQSIECDDVDCNLTTKNNKAAHFHSEKTIISSESKDLFLIGPVIGNLDELQFSGENFKYNFNNHLVSTNSPLFLKHPIFKIFSNKTLINLRNKKVTMLGKIKSEFNIAELQQQLSHS